MVARHCDGDCGNKDCKISYLEEQVEQLQDKLASVDDERIYQWGLAEDRKKEIQMLRDALSQMDLTICSMGDLMTKEDQEEALRLEALRDRVLKETE